MSLSVTCPGCSTTVTAPDAAAGKKVRCPKCQAAVPVPAASDDFEVVEDAPAKPKKKPVVADDNEDEDERPRKKKPVVADNDEDDRPRKKKRRDDDDDDDDDRPRKKKRRSRDDDEEKAGVSMTRNIIMGTVLLVLVAVAGVIFYGKYHEADDGAKKSDPRAVGPEDPNLKRAGVGGAGGK